MTVANTEIKFLFDGKEYDDFYLSLINKAQNKIVLHTYIFKFDNFGKEVFESLISAVTRGVHVSLVVDSFGTGHLERKYLIKMKEKGIHFYEFNKIRWMSIHRWGRRLHHKILIIDGQEAIVGGINVISSFDKPYKEPRLDFAFFMNGLISQEIEDYCMQISATRRKKKFKLSQFNKNDFESIRYSINDWVYGRKSIAKTYSEILDKAETEVIIINSYFFPRKKFLKKLAAAAERGVIVKLVLPKFSDWQSHVFATEYLYSYLLKNNIQVYQWSKSVLHGKMAVVDRKFTMLGSFNLHYTSFQGNLELNIEVLSEQFSSKVVNTITSSVLDSCIRIEENVFKAKNVSLLSLKRFFFYSLLSVVSNFLLGFIHQEDIDKEEKVSNFFSVLRVFLSFFIFFLGILGLFLPFIPGILFILLSLLILDWTPFRATFD